MLLPGKVIWWVLILVFLLIVGMAFLLQNKDLFARAETQFSPLNQSEGSPPVEEGAETITYRGLDISPTDSPDTVIYKLFRNFDPLFLNETRNNKIFYGSFILDLKGNTYNIYNSDLISKLREGIRNFSSSDPSYQIGSNWQQPPNCGNARPDTRLTYDNGCWIPALDIQPNPCRIYVNSTTNDFDGKVKIKVVWYLGSTVGNKRIIYNIITLCDG
jgi:hypothetical protein